jgi:hypothetical protein
VSGQLQVSGDGPVALCVVCSAKASGPCARCEAPLCPDCCVITKGGVKRYAVCPGCSGASGALRSGWFAVLLWIGAPIVGLALLLALLHALTGR